MAEYVFAEFETSRQLARAIEHMRGRDYRDLEAYTPFRDREVEEALARRPSRLPFAIFAGGIVAATLTYGLEWLVNAYLYPLDVGGRPPHFPAAYVPITFEMGVLFASFTAFFGILGLGRLVRLWDPVFEIDGFERASIDRFWLRVSGPDESFDVDRARDDLRVTDPLRVVHQRGGRR